MIQGLAKARSFIEAIDAIIDSETGSRKDMAEASARFYNRERLLTWSASPVKCTEREIADDSMSLCEQISVCEQIMTRIAAAFINERDKPVLHWLPPVTPVALLGYLIAERRHYEELIA